MVVDSVAYIVRCGRCGVAKKTFNDLSKPYRTVSCNHCNETHSEWHVLREIPASVPWPLPDSKVQEGGASPSVPIPHKGEEEEDDQESLLEALRNIPEFIPLTEEERDRRCFDAAHQGGNPLPGEDDREEAWAMDTTHEPITTTTVAYTFTSGGSGSVPIVRSKRGLTTVRSPSKVSKCA